MDYFAGRVISRLEYASDEHGLSDEQAEVLMELDEDVLGQAVRNHLGGSHFDDMMDDAVTEAINDLKSKHL